MKVLVIDVGGSNLKLLMGGGFKRKIKSGKSMTPELMVKAVKAASADLDFDVITIGLPTPIVNNGPAVEPNNLAKGWTQFDFTKSFDKPLKVINDAAMQALGSYEGGRMLFIGLGTGLGSALIVDSVVVPLELGELAYSRERTLEDVLGKAAFKKGKKEWDKHVHEVVALLKKAFIADYVMIGGGNAKRLEQLPDGARRGHNDDAYYGGVRLWEPRERVKRKKHTLKMPPGEK